jgi:hypothetical protein
MGAVGISRSKKGQADEPANRGQPAASQKHPSENARVVHLGAVSLGCGQIACSSPVDVEEIAADAA